ncbi:TetR family transcriptional regulator [Sorangium sp. So ce136]|uniref:TetR family transcriptional regulator n=1 Tax=Sorangium sp. So ce136 TaxID=3133284 RepID=UPI003F10EDE0
MRTDETPARDAPPGAVDPGDTRARILDAALREFSARGYHATSVREIAALVGVTKTAVLYHFPGKADILAALAEPMLLALEATVAAAAGLGQPRVRWAVIEGLLEVWLAHRHLIRTNLHDLGLAEVGGVFARFRDALVRANHLVAGPRADLARRVRAAQAIAMLSDPVVLFADAPTDALRAEILRGVRQLLGAPGPLARGRRAASGPAADGSARQGGEGPARPRRGRPAAMSASMVARARLMHAAGSSAEQIAARLGVSRATVYRHLAPMDE